MIYLAKYIASSGVCSRRNAILLIKKGAVSVNNTCIKDPAYVIQDDDAVRVNNKLVKPEKYSYVLLNKPKGYITTTSDENKRNTVMDLLSSSIKQRLYPVGRLDQETTGLLLITNDGSLAQRLAHPRYEVSKIYQATLDTPLTMEHQKILKEAVKLADGPIILDNLIVLNQARTRLKVVLHSGKNRIIRRLFKHFGYNVLQLDRIGYAGLNKRGLRVGQWRFLTGREVKLIKNNE